jgi:hypothetical protein
LLSAERKSVIGALTLYLTGSHPRNGSTPVRPQAYAD